MTDFNPYQEWLGIPVPEKRGGVQNYYQLLGIEDYLSDNEAISHAADRQLSKVRSFRPGEHARQWAALLDELSEAKKTLTSAEKKSAYDETLRNPPPEPAAPASSSPETPTSPPPPSSNPYSSAMMPPGRENPANPPSPSSMPPGYGPPADASAASPSAPTSPQGAPNQGSTQGTNQGINQDDNLFGEDEASLAGPPGFANYGRWKTDDPNANPAPNPAADAAAGNPQPYVDPYVGGNYTPVGPTPASDLPDPMAPVPGAAPTPAGPSFDLSAPSAQNPQPTAQPTAQGNEAQQPVVFQSTVSPPGTETRAVPVGPPQATTPSPTPATSPETVDEPKPTSVLENKRVVRTGPTSTQWAMGGAIMVGVALVSFVLGRASVSTPTQVADGTQINQPEGGTDSNSNPGNGNNATNTGNNSGNNGNETNPGTNPGANPGTNPGTNPTPGVTDPMPNPPDPMEEMPVTMDPEVDPMDPTDPMMVDPLDPLIDPLNPDPGSNPDSNPGSDPDPMPMDPDPEMVAMTPDPMPMPEKIEANAETVAVLQEALLAAKKAMTEKDLIKAGEQLEIADKYAVLKPHKEKVERLKLLANYLNQYWNAVDEGLKQMKDGGDLEVGTSTVVSVIEVTPTELKVRVAGSNRSYPLDQIPDGLSKALAERWLDDTDPLGKVVLGAIHAVQPTPDQKQKARDYWQEAQFAGVGTVDQLMPVLTDKYDNLANDLP